MIRKGFRHRSSCGAIPGTERQVSGELIRLRDSCRQSVTLNAKVWSCSTVAKGIGRGREDALRDASNETGSLTTVDRASALVDLISSLAVMVL